MGFPFVAARCFDQSDDEEHKASGAMEAQFAKPHDHPLHLGDYSVHTTTDAPVRRDRKEA
jgi:hypothetical protein